MSVFARFKKILTWTIMSTTVITMLTLPTAMGSEANDFGFRIIKQQEAKVARQLTCLARNVFYEANGEPMAGQMAVAQVTVNRAKSGMFPSDLCAVVAQTTVVEGDRVCQFSWMCDSRVNKNRVIDKNNPSYIAAKKVFLEGERVASIDKNVMWFHAADIEVNPKWPHKVAAKIGNHVFYKREK